jgi:hypothetical protein
MRSRGTDRNPVAPAGLPVIAALACLRNSLDPVQPAKLVRNNIPILYDGEDRIFRPCLCPLAGNLPTPPPPAGLGGPALVNPPATEVQL